MNTLISTRTSLLPQSSISTYLDHLRQSNQKPINPANKMPIHIVPQMSGSEHQKRIIQWTKSVKPIAPDEEKDDDVDLAQSLLIDEGVQRLNDWDYQLNANDPRRKKREAAATRMNLIAELKKIKQSIDPEDTITPRMVVQEFEQFMEAKKSVRPKKIKIVNKSNTDPPMQKDPATATSTGDKQVLSNGQPEVKQGQDQELNKTNWRENAGKANVGFSVIYPSENSKDKRNSGVDKNGQLELHKQVKAVQPNNDPTWWKKKIRQGFLQTEEMMSKLVDQRRKDEIVFKMGENNIRESNPIYQPTVYNKPKTYASIAARATRVEKQRLDKSMERLRQHHEKCFGGSCINPGNTSKVEDLEVLRSRKSKRPPSQPKKVPKPFAMSSVVPDRTRDPIILPKAITTKFVDPSLQQKHKPERENEYFEKLKTQFKMDDKSPAKNNKKEVLKSTLEPAFRFKVPTEPVEGTSKKSHKNPAVKILFERHLEGHQNTDYFEPPSDHKMGSEKWPKEYLQPLSYKPDFQPENAKYPPNKFNTGATLVAMKNAGRSEWVKRIMDARKNQSKREDEKARAAVEKQRADTNALYDELLLNKTRLQNEVEVEKRKMEWNWKNEGKHAQVWNKKDKDKLPERFKKYEDDVDEDSRTEIHARNKEPIQYSWKERPKGLNLWLEGVMAKAKEERDAKEKFKNKDILIPLSSYQF